MKGSWLPLLMGKGQRPLDIAGQRYGLLVALRPTDERLRKSVVWECVCDCGGRKFASSSCLRKGSPKSCGCAAQVPPPIRVKHGMFGHPLYKTWEGMMARCYNENNKDFYLYGGRGIKVCERWHDPGNFAKDMSPRPNGRTLDRVDNSRGYGPDNCRWATSMEQHANKRNNKLFTIDGETLHQREWCRRYGIPVSTFTNRLNEGLEPLTALTMPSRRPRRATQ